MRIYLDPAALVRRVSRDAAASRLRQQIHESWWVGDLLATSEITQVELARFAGRFGIPQAAIQDALAGIEFVPMASPVLAFAAEPQFTSLNMVTALHVASAKYIGADSALCYDPGTAAALKATGVAILNP